MSGDASGTGSDENDGRRESSAADPDVSDGQSASDAGSNPRAETRDSDRDRDRDRNRDRIPIDLSTNSDDALDSDEETDGDRYAPEPGSTPIEAGDPDLENAIFVALGAIAMILVILRVVSIPM